MTIGIMSAMPEEACLLAAALAGATTRTHGGRAYITGELECGGAGAEGSGARVVVVFSRMGKVAAAATAQHLIDVHGVGSIVFTGVAGSLSRDLRIGDVVVADELWQHDMDASPLFPALEVPLLGVSSFRADAGIARRLRAGAEAFVREDLAARMDAGTRLELGVHEPRVVVGGIASGDRFVSTGAERNSIVKRIPRAMCVEMEGAAVAQVCHEQGVPLGVVRVMSDGADEGAAVDFGRFVREAASHYGLGIMRRFIAMDA